MVMESIKSRAGMVVAPHHLAATAGAEVLRDGGNAIEAMVAAAAAIAVCYPHMNGLGGDNFWVIHQPGAKPVGIDACGAAAGLANSDFYHNQDLAAIPGRGPLSALTIAGAVSGWQTALEHSTNKWRGRIPLERLLAPAIDHAREGVPVTNTLASNLTAKISQLRDQPGFAALFLNKGLPLTADSNFKLPAIADTLETLSRAGLDDFYRGHLARSMATDLEAVGSPLRLADFNHHHALKVEPLALELAGHQLFNLPPPTQGLASLLLLGVFERLGIQSIDTFDFVHGLVEATKSAFRIRDAHICDPAYMTQDPQGFLDSACLDDLAGRIDMRQAAPWPDSGGHSDTVWLGAIDSEGRSVSFIQSIYWEFGSGVVLPGTGITWQNRGTSFSLDPNNINQLRPGKRPFHTIQPALALLADGRSMAYGTMGGEGQPQTQAMIFARHVMNGQELQKTITAPRWLLGRTWGSEQTNLRIENRFDPAMYDELRNAGHDLEVIGEFDEIMGHAGALVHHPDGLIEGASDPRSDGAAVGS